jgi:hypothetical protein
MKQKTARSGRRHGVKNTLPARFGPFAFYQFLL